MDVHQGFGTMYCHAYKFGLVIRFIGHLQVVTIGNYSAIANSHFATACTKSSQFDVSSPVVAWWRIPTMSSVSVLTFLPAGFTHTTQASGKISHTSKSVSACHVSLTAI
jgi:hypothetical protein